MLRANTRRTMIPLFAATLLLFMVPQPMLGQGLPACESISVSSLEIMPFATDPIEVPGETTETIEWIYRAPEQAFSIEPVEILFSVGEIPEWLELTIEPKEALVAVAPLEETRAEGTVNVTASIQPGAPEGIHEETSFLADAEEGTCVTASAGEATMGFNTAEPEDEEQGNASDDPAPVNEATIPGPSLLLGTTLAGLAAAYRRRR